MQHELENLQRKEKVYEENKEVIEDLEGIIKDKNNLELQLVDYNSGLEDCESVLLELYKSSKFSSEV